MLRNILVSWIFAQIIRIFGEVSAESEISKKIYFLIPDLNVIEKATVDFIFCVIRDISPFFHTHLQKFFQLPVNRSDFWLCSETTELENSFNKIKLNAKKKLKLFNLLVLHVFTESIVSLSFGVQKLVSTEIINCVDKFFAAWPNYILFWLCNCVERLNYYNKYNIQFHFHSFCGSFNDESSIFSVWQNLVCITGIHWNMYFILHHFFHIFR